MAENLKQPNPLMTVVAGAIGGLVTGTIAIAVVWMTNRFEALKIQREDRKQAYIQYIRYVLKTDIANSYKNSEPPIDVERYVDEFTGSISALVLLSPEIADRIIEIHQKYQLDAKFQEEWIKLSNELKNNVFPLMQAELKVGECWWRFWK